MQTVHAAFAPAHAKQVHRDVTAAGTVYTVPAGQILVITSAWAAIGQPNTTPAAGRFTISAPSEDDSTPHVLASAVVGDNAGQANVCNSADLYVRVPGGGTVVAALTGAASSQVAAGFCGFLFNLNASV